jgi:hypothetical protein
MSVLRLILTFYTIKMKIPRIFYSIKIFKMDMDGKIH